MNTPVTFTWIKKQRDQHPMNFPSAPFESAPIPHPNVILTSNKPDWFCRSLYFYKWNHKLRTLLLQSFSTLCLWNAYVIYTAKRHYNWCIAIMRCCIPSRRVNIPHYLLYSTVTKKCFCKHSHICLFIHIICILLFWIYLGLELLEQSIWAFQKTFPTRKSSLINDIMC